MAFNVRKLKNSRRGTETTYATIPLKDINNLTEREIQSVLGGVVGYGNRRPEDENLAIASYIVRNKGKLEYGSTKNKSGKLSEVLKDFARLPDEERLVRLDVFGRSSDEQQHYLKLVKRGNRIRITPQPFIHSVTEGLGAYEERNGLRVNAWDYLQKIFEEGFRKRPNRSNENAYLKERKEHRGNQWGEPVTSNDITQGDVYHIELFHQKGTPYESADQFSLNRARIENILGINIEIDSSLPKEVQNRKMKFYREQITKKHNIPVRFYSAIKTKNFAENFGRKYLEHRLSAIIGTVGIIGGLIFLSNNITGNVIGSLNTSSSNVIGAVLLLVGLVGAFFWLKKR